MARGGCSPAAGVGEGGGAPVPGAAREGSGGAYGGLSRSLSLRPVTPPKIPPPGTFTARLVNVGSQINVWVYRASGGRLGGKMQQLPVLLLEHVGRKSGQKRVAPLLYLQDGDDLV